MCYIEILNLPKNYFKEKHELLAKSKKDHYYQVNDFKVVTGVGIKQRKKVVLNSKRK